MSNEGPREDCICDGCLTIKNLKLNVEELGRKAEVLKRINEGKRFINGTWLVLNAGNEKSKEVNGIELRTAYREEEEEEEEEISEIYKATELK